MIIDVHCHNFPDAIATRAMAGMCRQTEGVLWAVGDGTVANHLDHLDLAGVAKAVVCPIATKPEQWEVILRRALAIRSGELGERAQRKFIPFASVHPLDPDFAAHLEAIADAGIKGVKFHPYYQDFSLADPKCWPMFRKIAELGLVVQCHAGEDVSWRDLRGMCGPEDIALLLRNVPDLGPRFIAAHLGGVGGYPAHATDALLDTGCYIDTSVLHHNWFRDEEMRVLRSWPTDRILFGTDFPWTHYPEAIRHVKSIRESADLDALFGGNACRLLGI